jgi:putative transposase
MPWVMVAERQRLKELDALGSSHWVGPVCHELNIAQSTYCRYIQNPEKRSQRDRRDDQLKREIQQVYDENYGVYGIHKVWHQLQRESFSVARCTVARLMKTMGFAGVLRGKRCVPPSAVRLKRVNRQFVAERPNQLWCEDFTYVSTWQGFAYVAFIIDLFACVIVCWRVSPSMKTTFVLDAL